MGFITGEPGIPIKLIEIVEILDSRCPDPKREAIVQALRYVAYRADARSDVG